MYIMLNSEPYAEVKDFDLWANGSLGCTLIGINVETTGRKTRLYPIYKPWITFIREEGKFVVEVPLAKIDVLILSFVRRWPFLDWRIDKMGLRKL